MKIIDPRDNCAHFKNSTEQLELMHYWRQRANWHMKIASAAFDNLRLHERLILLIPKRQKEFADNLAESIRDLLDSASFISVERVTVGTADRDLRAIVRRLTREAFQKRNYE